MVNGFYFDPAIPPPPPAKENEENADADMEDGTDTSNKVYAKCPGEPKYPDDTFLTRERMQKKAKIEAGKEMGCDDDLVVNTPYSMHESQPMSSASKFDLSKADTMVMSGQTLVLSHELQETLARRKLRDDFLPKSMMAGANGSAMSLVLWKPPPKGEIFSKQSQVAKLAKERITTNQWSSSFQRSLEKPATTLEEPSRSPFSSVPLAINTLQEPVSPMYDDEEGMDID